jgi:hypothetical protein
MFLIIEKGKPFLYVKESVIISVTFSKVEE